MSIFGVEHPETPLRRLVCQAMAEISHIRDMENGVRVTTHCMYPSNGLVRVTVRGGDEYFVASDEGEALGEALAAGIEITDPDKLVRGFVKQQGLMVSNGVIFTRRQSLKAVLPS